MENKLLEFKQLLDKKEVEDVKIKELKEDKNPMKYFYSCSENIGFYLSYVRTMTGTFNFNIPVIRLLELDSEDLEYFKKKYLPKLDEEYEKNLKELNSKYNK